MPASAARRQNGSYATSKGERYPPRTGTGALRTLTTNVPTAINLASSCSPVAWSRREMADYKVHRSVVLVSELPRNATGKVVKQQLREAPGG